MFELPSILLHISIILTLIIGIFVYRMKNKEQIHYAFLMLIGCVFFWDFFGLIEKYLILKSNLYLHNIITKYEFMIVILIPLSIFFLGLIFAHKKINFSPKYLLLFVIPSISLTLFFTNSFHHLFFKIGFQEYILDNVVSHFGPYFYIHMIYSYSLIFIGLYYLLHFSIRNAGFFSKQALLIFFGILISLVTNILYTIHVIKFDTTYVFAFTLLLFFFAIFKFDFLNIVPVNLQKIVDNISDSFVVIDENYNIIDYNKTFFDCFKDLIQIKRSNNLLNELTMNEVRSIDTNEFIDVINKSTKNNKTISFEKVIRISGQDKVFDIDVTPISNNDKHVGIVILFKDMTDLRNAHEQLLKQERFSALGQLMGGIAHDLNSRLYALEGQIYLINKFAHEIKDNDILDRTDYIDIAHDISKRIDEMKLAANGMAKTINSVRNYTRNYSSGNIENFSMKKVIETIESLLNQKLIIHNCVLNYKQNKTDDIYIKGDFSKFESVLINIVSNAIEAYAKDEQTKVNSIEIFAEDRENEIIISVTDYGYGMPKNIRNLMFKEIYTTKGANGTGMGLYFSHNMIVSNFKGDIWFNSEVGKGTTFYIKIPKEI